MARSSGRTHARIQLDIWTGNFTELTIAEQIVYLALVSSVDLSYCGVAPLLPKRLTLLSADLTERKAKAALDGLAARRYIVIDEDTDEVLVRTYIRHDGILRQPNMIRAMTRAFRKVHSEHLREVIRHEVGKALDDGFPDGLPDGIAKALGEGFPDGFGEGPGEQRYHSPSPFPLPLKQHGMNSSVSARAEVMP